MGDAVVHVVAEVVNAAHGIDDVGFKDLAHRRRLAADIGHVVVAGIAFVTHVPKDRGKAILLGGRNDILVPLHAALLVEIQVGTA